MYVLSNVDTVIESQIVVVVVVVEAFIECRDGRRRVSIDAMHGQRDLYRGSLCWRQFVRRHDVQRRGTMHRQSLSSAGRALRRPVQRRELREQRVSERKTSGRDQWRVPRGRRVSAAARLRAGARCRDEELSADGEHTVVADAGLARPSLHAVVDVRRRARLRRQRRCVCQRRCDAADGQQRCGAGQRGRCVLDDGTLRLWSRVRCAIERVRRAVAVQARRGGLLLQRRLVWRGRVVSQRLLSCGGSCIAHWRRLLGNVALR